MLKPRRCGRQVCPALPGAAEPVARTDWGDAYSPPPQPSEQAGAEPNPWAEVYGPPDGDPLGALRLHTTITRPVLAL